jgi:hypothetical protein
MQSFLQKFAAIPAQQIARNISEETAGMNTVKPFSRFQVFSICFLLSIQGLAMARKCWASVSLQQLIQRDRPCARLVFLSPELGSG